MSVPLSMDEIPPLPEPEGSTLKMQLKQVGSKSCTSFANKGDYMSKRGQEILNDMKLNYVCFFLVFCFI